jgi:hypothetical protein
MSSPTIREVPGADLPEHPAVKTWGRLWRQAGVPRRAVTLCGFQKKAWQRTVCRLEARTDLRIHESGQADLMGVTEL